MNIKQRLKIKQIHKYASHHLDGFFTHNYLFREMYTSFVNKIMRYKILFNLKNLLL
jgi:hypothetical protein